MGASQLELDKSSSPLSQAVAALEGRLGVRGASALLSRCLTSRIASDLLTKL